MSKKHKKVKKQKPKKKKKKNHKKGDSLDSMNTSGVLGTFRGKMQTVAKGGSENFNSFLTVLLWVAVFVMLFFLLRRYNVF